MTSFSANEAPQHTPNLEQDGEGVKAVDVYARAGAAFAVGHVTFADSSSASRRVSASFGARPGIVSTAPAEPATCNETWTSPSARSIGPEVTSTCCTRTRGIERVTRHTTP